jgi:hypothetical protein
VCAETAEQIAGMRKVFGRRCRRKQWEVISYGIPFVEGAAGMVRFGTLQHSQPQR